ncbi:TRAP transporter small permease subunit [Aliihoeflea aestuarii]|uniref:TRAP transporter small permease subunit n=1 Tax=Aliihoeflea aestuarii TaxID=453840 RepID=UPI002092D0A8|nr:TRAP transporter small permease subunit [Aliihoeflea aestuarii]MCO6389629.1 TRAP transporter small permease subunit [Aliihoeflea aestuarii]
MKFLRDAVGAITWVNGWVGRLTAYLVLPMFVLLLMEVGFRYVLRAPSVWTGELSQLIFGVYALMGGGYLLANNGHVSVDIFYANYARRTQARMDVATSILFFLFVGVIVWQGASLAYDSVTRLETSQSAWNPPIWPVKLMIPVAALLLFLQGLAKLLNDIMIATGRPPILTETKSDHSAGAEL